MKKDEKLSRWIIFGLLGIPLPLLTYFYLVLHIGFSVPLKDLIYPSAIFCAFVPIFSAGAFWGTRARSRGNSCLLFIVIGAFALLCGVEFSYFEVKLGFVSRDNSSYGFTLVWATLGTTVGYILDRWIRQKDGGNIQG